MTPREIRAFLFELPQDATVKDLRAMLFKLSEQDEVINTEVIRDVAWGLVVTREKEQLGVCLCDRTETDRAGLVEVTYNPACTIHDSLNY